MARFKLDAAGIDAWDRGTTLRTVKMARAAIRTLADRVIDTAPMDTGFMIASAKVRLNPRRSLKERQRPPRYKNPAARSEKKTDVRAKLAQMKLQDKFGITFVAEYTKWVHEGTSRQAAQPFLENAARAWPAIVRATIARYKK